MQIKVKCPAKINLSLDVTGKRVDGYHELDPADDGMEFFSAHL